MNTVKDALAQKSGALIHVCSGDMVVEALRQMRDNRVRSVLVIDDDVLVGIMTQGDCAIKVLLPGLDAKQTPVGQVMTGDPVTVKGAVVSPRSSCSNRCGAIINRNCCCYARQENASVSTVGRRPNCACSVNDTSFSRTRTMSCM